MHEETVGSSAKAAASMLLTTAASSSSPRVAATYPRAEAGDFRWEANMTDLVATQVVKLLPRPSSEYLVVAEVPLGVAPELVLALAAATNTTSIE